tara:strand:+ start:1844 stop:3466 length:1623 start_codon:yes stop_codon:yes gene_type:complete
MNILGIYIGGHDSNISISIDGKVQYFKFERILGKKHAQVQLNEACKWVCNNYNFKPDIIVYSDGERNSLGKCFTEKELYKKLPDSIFYTSIKNQLKECCNTDTDEIYILDHHFTHTLSNWPVVDTEKQDFGIVVDGRGDQEDRFTIFKNPYDIIQKELLDEGVYTKPENILFKSTSFNAPAMLRNIGKLMGLKGNPLDIPGKIMGAYAYGTPDIEFVNHFLDQLKDPFNYFNFNPKTDPKDFINSMKLDQYCSPPYDLTNSNFVNYLSSAHYLLGEIILKIIQKHCSKDSILTYTGGVTQNTVWNEVLYNNFNNLHLSPHCYDGGMSLGCLEFARILFNLPKLTINNFPYIQSDIVKETPDEQTIDKVVDLLVEGKIIGWMQGGGEVGPRALGNRSILMHPGIKNGKNIINAKVKHREYWRPFAPSVLEEHTNEWFEIDEPSPYMLRAVKAKKSKLEEIKSVVHEDHTSRIQTVNKKQNPLYYKLISKFYKKTGIPLLLNTSLNAGGSPIFAHVQQVEQFFNDPKVDIDAICVGNKLAIK